MTDAVAASDVDDVESNHHGGPSKPGGRQSAGGTPSSTADQTGPSQQRRRFAAHGAAGKGPAAVLTFLGSQEHESDLV